MSARATSAQQVIKPWQWAVETTEGTTPAAPAFTAVPVENLAFRIDGGFVDVGQIGPEDLLTIAQGPQTYESSVKLWLNSATYLDYAVEAVNWATPAGTIAQTLTHLYSIYLAGTENYLLFKGSRARSASITLAVGRPVEATIDWVHTAITAPAAAHGLTTPTFAPAPTDTAIWTWASGGTNPVSWNGAGIKAQNVTININRNTEVEHTLGNPDPYASLPHQRGISGTMACIWTDTTMEADFRAATPRTLGIVLKTGVATLTLTNTTITGYKRTDLAAGSTDMIKEEIDFRATGITLT